VTEWTDQLNSGIGLESAILFASEGAHVVLADINLAAAEKAKEIIGNKHPNVKTLVVKANVGKENEVEAMVDQAVKEFGRLDIMVNDFLHNAQTVVAEPLFSM
jgi:NAD(P)-dependent dehydrogenase (short-subunit alcohol dehydrogenase family)